MLAQVFGGKVQVFFLIEILRSLAAMRTQVSKVLGVNVFSWQNRTFYPIQILMQEMRVCRLTFLLSMPPSPPLPARMGGAWKVPWACPRPGGTSAYAGRH